MSSFEKYRFESQRRKSLFYKLVFANLFIETFSIFATYTFSLYNSAIPMSMLMLYCKTSNFPLCFTVQGGPVFLFYIAFFMLFNTAFNILLDIAYPYLLLVLSFIKSRYAEDQE